MRNLSEAAIKRAELLISYLNKLKYVSKAAVNTRVRMEWGRGGKKTLNAAGIERCVWW